METISISAQVHVDEAHALENWLRSRVLIHAQSIADLLALLKGKDDELLSVKEEAATRLRTIEQQLDEVRRLLPGEVSDAAVMQRAREAVRDALDAQMEWVSDDLATLIVHGVISAWSIEQTRAGDPE